MANRKEDANSVIPFVQLVEKYPCIWNYKLKTYSKTDVTRAAWREIAEEINDTEINCRERWKNIRTAFGRSLRQPKSGSGRISKKKYYLSEYMSFLMPYLKGGDQMSCNLEDSAVEETEDSHAEVISVNEMPNEHSTITSIEKPTPPKPQKFHSMKNKVEDAFLEWMRMKKETKEKERDADEMFLKSLLPDLKKLSDRRKRKFKIQAMSLLNSMLEEDERETSGSSVSVFPSPSTPYDINTHQQE
ncbi:hypothetical protein J437_LFUL001544 [Ladona fulva]|uniref:Transcription factor Adf-1 n=1 Tax=Ladona fulva TaxID=123851 RepID=A0A8K0NVK1_LADFU|nr:hypothetical protein J437_LFUL001544 [Ladona fulva]